MKKINIVIYLSQNQNFYDVIIQNHNIFGTIFIIFKIISDGFGWNDCNFLVSYNHSNFVNSFPIILQKYH
jgi:hypothetical protein